MSSHAILSASSAKRWMSCTPSARLEALGEQGGQSSYAEEGTLAHKLAELYLQRYLNLIGDSIFRQKHAAIKLDGYYNTDMEVYVCRYVEEVIQRFQAVKEIDPDACMMLEQRLNFSKYVPKGFGTGDVIILGSGIIEVIDLKYGQGVAVSAQDNPQLRLYGLGACETFGMLYDFNVVGMTIAQPRLDSFSNETLTVKELESWGKNEVVPKAQLAFAGKGDFVVGEHCQFCKAKAQCRARAEHNLEVLRYDFMEAQLLSDDEIAEILSKTQDLVKWVNTVTSYALQKALNGTKFNGWKVVEGRGRRKYGDEAGVINLLKEKGFEEDAIFKPRELLNLTDLESLLGKKVFKEYLTDFIVSQPGKPDIVQESDKRPEITSVGIDLMLD